MRRELGVWGPVTGIAAALALGFGMSRASVDAGPGEPSGVLLERYRDAADDLDLAVLLTVLGLGLLLLFLGFLRAELRARGAGWPADGVFAGGLAFTTAALVDTAARITASVGADEGHVSVVRAANDLIWESAWLASPGLLALGASAAVVSFAARALPLWLGAFAVLLALTALVPWMGVGGFVFWVLGAAIAELVRGVRGRAIAARTA